jgi:L-ribulokinase
MQVAASSQACALGSAVTAAVLAGPEKGGHPDFKTAQAAMTSIKDKAYTPNAANHAVYDKLYKLYLQLHDAFGGVNKSVDLSNVMKDLIAIRESQRRTQA